MSSVEASYGFRLTDRKAELKARLVAEAEAAIEQMLAAADAPAKASLADIERSARTTGQRLEQMIAAELAGADARALPAWSTARTVGKR